MSTAEVQNERYPVSGDLEPYDFRRPAVLTRSQSRALHSAFEVFARQCGTQLTAKMRAVSSVSLESISLHTNDELMQRMPALTSIVLLTIGGVESRAGFQFSTRTALAWVTRLLGGPVTGAFPERRFTVIEETLVRNLVGGLIDDLKYALGTLMTRTIELGSTQYDATFALAGDSAELMTLVRLDVRIGERRSSIALTMPAAVLLEHLDESERAGSGRSTSELLERRLADVPVELAIRLTPTPLSPTAVLGLSVGDLIPLSHSRQLPLVLTVEGEPLGHAAIGSNGSRLACVVVSTEGR